jgi:hypothetical protein
MTGEISLNGEVHKIGKKKKKKINFLFLYFNFYHKYFILLFFYLFRWTLS